MPTQHYGISVMIQNSALSVTENRNANNRTDGTAHAEGGALGICAISDRSTKDQYEISVYADMIAVKARPLTVTTKRPSGAVTSTRGKVAGFSRRSRKRMIDTIAKIRARGSILFLTLTYPDNFPVGDADRWRRDREAIRKRLMRRCSGWGFIWRTEIKERQSGALNEGADAPHWHLIAFAPYQNDALAAAFMLSLLKEHWHEIAGAGDVNHKEHGADVRIVRGRRGAYYYVSKYVAKCDQEEHEIGRRWGIFGDMDLSPNAFVARLTVHELVQLKRLIRAWLKPRSRGYAKIMRRIARGHGFSVYGLGDGTEQSGALAIAWFLRQARLLAGRDTDIYPDALT